MKRVVMRVEVLWITDDPNSLVEQAFRHYDKQGIAGPVDLVAGAMKMALAGTDMTAPVDGHGLEVRIDGPVLWAAAFEADDSA